MKDHYEKVTTLEELTELQGTPGKLAENKVIPKLDDHCIQFIRHCPFVMISTANRHGACDASPRGDVPGFVCVIDQKTLVIPERMGNRRMDSMKNLLENPRIGLLFMIPGIEETLRMNGEAIVTKDQRLLQKLEANGHIPNVAILVQVEEAYIHCAKAFKRSRLWQPEQWPDTRSLLSPARMLADHVKLEGFDEDRVQDSLNESYTNRLY